MALYYLQLFDPKSSEMVWYAGPSNRTKNTSKAVILDAKEVENICGTHDVGWPVDNIELRVQNEQTAVLPIPASPRPKYNSTCSTCGGKQTKQQLSLGCIYCHSAQEE